MLDCNLPESITSGLRVTSVETQPVNNLYFVTGRDLLRFLGDSAEANSMTTKESPKPPVTESEELGTRIWISLSK